jgi:hypothetical protein
MRCKMELAERTPLFAWVLIGCNRGPQVLDVKTNEEKADVSLEAPKTYRGSLEPLSAYRGKELANLDEIEAKELLATIRKLVPDREYRFWFDFWPWYVWEFPNKGRPILLLFEVDNTSPHPGSSGIRITVFEKTGNAPSESEFWTGHRCYLGAVSLDKIFDDQDPLIVLETGLGGGPGPNVQKQIYARIGNRFDLIRLEDGHGKATRNTYYVNHFACGPMIPTQTQAEWEADVLSGDRFRILRSLVWLGGVHWEGKPPDKSENQHEQAEQIELVRSVRASKKVADKLKVLATSEDRWVREAAALAANPKDNRWW